MLARYARNLGPLTEGECEALALKTVAVVGCGGLGGHAIDQLARLGVGAILAIDGDRFEESNLNRQLLSEVGVLGSGKADAAASRVGAVNPLVRVTAIPERLGAANADSILASADLVIDATDSVASRLVLEASCARLGIPLVHGAVGGWYGQTGTCFPGDRLISRIYGESGDLSDAGRPPGNLSFGPAIVASLQVAESVKILSGKGPSLRNRLLVIDLLLNDFQVVDLPPA